MFIAGHQFAEHKAVLLDSHLLKRLWHERS
jgi:hypothetical protein